MADTPSEPLPSPIGAYAPPPDVWIEGDHPTHNPDGVTNSNHDYWPKTQEEKAERLLVEMVELLELEIDEPYPTGNPPGEDFREEQQARLHTPVERISAEDRYWISEKNLKAGGLVEGGQVE